MLRYFPYSGRIWKLDLTTVMPKKDAFYPSQAVSNKEGIRL